LIVKRTGLLAGIVVFIVGSSAWATRPEAEDWKGFRGANGDSTTSGSGIFSRAGAVSLDVRWKNRIGSGYSSVSVADGVAINLFSDPGSDFAGAFDANTGRELWRFRLGDRYPGRWGSKDGPISTPLIDRGRVFMLDPAGHFFCLDFKTGKKIWDADLKKAHGSTEPFYGFASSPLVVGDTVVLQIGGPKGATVAAFDVASGKVMWKTGPEDAVNYQSASLMSVAGKPVLIALGDRIMSGHDPRTGETYWTIEYGDATDIGSKTAQVVKTSGNRFFVNGRASDSTLFELSATDQHAPPKEVWKTRHIRNTYVISVYHDGLLFGYNGRILACVDAESGELVWRSREPGDGFPIMVDGHLVIATKEGRLSIAPASRKGYEEIANIPVLDDDLVWSTATFVDRSLYLRSIESWARVDIRQAPAAATAEKGANGIIADSEFGRFVSRVAQAEQKQPLIDAYLAAHSTLPVIEGKDMVHFVYHGPGKDISMSSDLFGERFDRPLNRIEGTQFFYYSSRLESDARLPYGFIRDFDEFLGDPANPAKVEGSKVALVSMPDWKEPDFLRDPPAASRGRVEDVTLASRQFGVPLGIKVYLPKGYEPSRSYPVAYVLSGTAAIKEGRMVEALDNLIGRRVEPLIAVFVPDPGERPGANFSSRKSYLELAGDDKDKTRLMLVEELLPLVEGRYRIDAKAGRRAIVAYADAAYAGLYATLRHPDLFAGLGLLSPSWEPGYRPQNTALLRTPADQPLRIYLEWGRYDSRSPREGWDAVEHGRAFSATLRSKGYSFVGGETHEGADWLARRNRLDRLFSTLFPLN
jgi:enterochelin esterase-like enzyme/outer membrane protein assembly factor BamB